MRTTALAFPSLVADGGHPCAGGLRRRISGSPSCFHVHAGRTRLAVGADGEELVPLRDFSVEDFARGFIGFAQDADALVAAVGGLDRAGNFHLNSLCPAPLEALQRLDFRGIEQAYCVCPGGPGQVV
jgi:hypothetical protein